MRISPLQFQPYIQWSVLKISCFEPLTWLNIYIYIYIYIMIVDQEHFQRFRWEEGGANFDSGKTYGRYM